MKFDDLDARMRVYETAHDFCVLPGLFMVARIDGRSFTRLTRERHRFEAPYDPVFRDHMVETTKHLMDCGFRTVFGYTQSDEISIVLHRDDDTFGRKLRKLNSVLAGEASAVFSVRLGDAAAFDCRICQLPTLNVLVDYLRWRNEDAHRNALTGHCYWTLRNNGATAKEATASIERMSTADKNELLFSVGGVNFQDLPAWQKRGIGVYWEEYEKSGKNPVTGELVTARRRRLEVEMELPMRDAYSEFVREMVRAEHATG